MVRSALSEGSRRGHDGKYIAAAFPASVAIASALISAAVILEAAVCAGHRGAAVTVTVIVIILIDINIIYMIVSVILVVD
jgi:hypothetical protein